jgi:hypothetical protein
MYWRWDVPLRPTDRYNAADLRFLDAQPPNIAVSAASFPRRRHPDPLL